MATHRTSSSSEEIYAFVRTIPRGKVVAMIDNARLDASMDTLHEYLGV